MYATSVRNETSVVRHVLLGSVNSTLRTAIESLELQSILFARIEPIITSGNDVSELVRIGYRTTSDAATECREHANEGDVLGAFDCLARAISGHRTAKYVLSVIVEFGDAEVVKLARLGVTLSMSVLSDLGCECEN